MPSLFYDNRKKTYLSVIYNDEPYTDDIRKLFDDRAYDSLKICTFVASPKHFFKETEGFDEVELILGIEDNDIAQKFFFDSIEHSKFFESIPKTALEKIANNKIRIRFTPLGVTIHSKIYLLENSKNGERRAIIGSANFSIKAFSNKSQYEELAVYDSSYNLKVVDHYFNRFEAIRIDTLDFVPERFKKKIKEGSFNLIVSDDESIKLLASNITNMQAMAATSDAISDVIEGSKNQLMLQETECRQALESAARTKTIIKIVTKNVKGRSSFITPLQIARKKEQIITKTMKAKVVKREFVDSRIGLFYGETEQRIFLKKSNGEPVPYSMRADVNTIKEKLKLLDRFIHLYTIYTANKADDAPKRIFETILYAFSSVYIWRFREEGVRQQGRDEIKTNVPIFMLIAGMSQSGKTHLIKFISQIMGNHGSYYNYIKQAQLMSMDQINPRTIYQFFTEDNLMPIFADETNKEYFSSTSSATSSYMGEGFIKNMTNTREGRHPCLIATSNTDFSANQQVMRRIYYIQLNNPFDASKKVEAAEQFNELLQSFDTDLYKDFLYRIEERFMQGIKIDVNDILSPAREIFKEYFELCEISVPIWFSNDRIDDYYIRGREMWRNLYAVRYYGFKENVKKNEILLDDEKVFGTKLSVNREKRELLQFLTVGIIIEEKGIVKLNRDKFFKFIGKSKNGGFFTRIAGLFGK